jgi:Leucine-rich repeat (LRR) protein
MKNSKRGPLSIKGIFALILVFLNPLFTNTIKAQAFEKTLDNAVGRSIAKDGNLIRVETCEDSSRVDLLFDQAGNVVRTERNFRGSCGLQRLADGSFIVETYSTNSSGNTVKLTKNLRSDGTLISSKTLMYPLKNSYISDKNGSFMYFENPYVPNVNTTKYMVNRYDSVGNRLAQYVLDTALLGGQYIYYYTNSEHIYAYKKAYDSYDIIKIWKFDKGGNLLATIPYNRGCRIIESNKDGKKLLFTGGYCTSVCVPNSLNYMDSDNGETVATMSINDNYLLYRTNAIHTDSEDNVWLVASDSEPCFGRYCGPSKIRLSILKFSKDGKLLFRKEYYHNVPLFTNDPQFRNVIAKDFIINDDGTIVIMGTKDTKLWLLKLNCSGEAVSTVPIATPFTYSDYLLNPKVWIRSTTINNATISTLDSFTFNGFRSYSLFKTPITTLQRGQTYPLSINVKTDSVQNLSKTYAGIWFDFNRNGQFDSTERVTLTKNNDVYSGTLQVPLNAAKGLVNVKARVRLNQQTLPNTYEAEGETEDYFVTIEGTNANACDNDTEAPTLRCPNTYTTNDTSKMVLPRPSFQDNCTDSANIIIAATYTDSFKFPVGRTSVTYSATDRSCNTSTCRFDVEVQATVSPDLTLANVNFRDPSVYLNGIAYFSFDAKNIGTGNATNAFTIKSYLSKDRVLDALDYQNGVISTANYPAGANILQIQGAMRLEASVFYGDYYLILKIDADNQITESNENNNVVASGNTIAVVPDSSCRYQDSLQLVRLYYATGGVNWTIKWDLSTPLNTWYNVKLTSEGCVKWLSLQTNNLIGTLPSNWRLSKIDTLTLHNNKLFDIVSNFEFMPNLKKLWLSDNQFNGNIPNFDLLNLEDLSLERNKLTGVIPNFNLPKLTNLNLSANQLSDTIPNFNLTNLRDIRIAENNLTKISNLNLPNLQVLRMSFNKLSNLQILDLPKLEELDINNNQLIGVIPTFNLPNLTYLNLRGNQLSGAFPTFNLPKLKELYLSFNQLNDTISNFTLNEIETIDLSYNQLSGKIPSLSLPRLANISFNNNRFSGNIPDFNFPLIRRIALSFNQLSGCIPLSFKAYCGKNISINNNPNLATQDFAAFCSAANTGACTVATHELSFIENQSIHPTITENNIVLELESIEDKQIDVDIINTLGNIMLKKHLKIAKGNNQLNFDVGNLPNALYFIQTSVGINRNVPMKFVKF